MKRLALAAIALAAASSAQAAEKVIDFQVDGKKIVGTLNVPDGATKPPAILLLHGFTGSRNELEIPAVKERIFARAARMWAEKGVASLRIDFMGSGDSEGDYADTTMEGQVKQALAALDFLAAAPEVDKDKLALVGWSMGGAVATAVAGRTEQDLDAVALWAAGTNMAASMTFFLGPEVMKKGLTAGDTAVEGNLPWGGKVSLKGPFFQSLYLFDPVAEIAEYDGPLLVAVGTKDDVIFPQPAAGQVLLDYHDGDEELIVWEMDHAFNAFVNAETVDKLITTTGDFVAKHLD